MKDTYDHKLITPIAPKHNWRILADSELLAFRKATYKILETVGVHFPLQKALDIFAEHGAAVDFENQIVKLSHDLVDKALANAPRYFNLGGREPDYDFHLQEGRSFYSTDGCMPFKIDTETGEKCPTSKDDVAKMARMADFLKPVAFYWPMASAGDHGEMAPLHEIHASYLNCRKHVQTESVMGETPARYALEMALAIAGDRETLRKRPPLSVLICCVDPLGQDDTG